MVTEIKEMRGVGEVYARAPIGAYLQLGWRKQFQQGDKTAWRISGSFGGSESETCKRCFNIMSAVPNRKVKRGRMETVERTPHPSFNTFNTAHPDKCTTIRAVLVNRLEKDAYKKNLGAFKSNSRDIPNPPSGWWCRGDGCRAERWVGGEFKEIKCPGSKCEFQQEGSGYKGKGRHCRPNASLLAQFRWESDLPQIIFQWDTKAWNNVGYLDGLFKQVEEGALTFGFRPGELPVIGLPIILTLNERTKTTNRFPVVSASVDGDLYAWLRVATELHRKGQALMSPAEPGPLEALPPPGATRADIDAAREGCLSPDPRPANVRVVE